MDKNFFSALPKATKILLILNVALFLVALLNESLNSLLALYYIDSPFFKPYQLLTHMFMHGGFTHLLFNMYALVMFGGIVEKKMGTNNFLVLYFIAAIGALLLHMAAVWFELRDVPADIIERIQTEGADLLANKQNYIDEYLGDINLQMNVPMVGASGAIMGVMAAFAFYFPNAKLALIFLPVPIKAKYFVPIFMVIELFLGVNNFEWDNIAHFAHLGGAILGFAVCLLLNKKQDTDYRYQT